MGFLCCGFGGFFFFGGDRFLKNIFLIVFVFVFWGVAYLYVWLVGLFVVWVFCFVCLGLFCF